MSAQPKAHTQDENLDLGRDLTWGDIVDPDTFPLEDTAVGSVYCHYCNDHYRRNLDGLEPLTRSTGVFTSRVRCENDAPVYLCLSHIPFSQCQFEVFSPEVAAELNRIKQQRERG